LPPGLRDGAEPSHLSWRRLARGAVARPDFPTVPIVLRIVFSLLFSLFSIVLAPADFLKPAQRLTLKSAHIFHCKSIVFFPKNFSASAGGKSRLARSLRPLAGTAGGRLR
jgi:hypothetical protein